MFEAKSRNMAINIQRVYIECFGFWLISGSIFYAKIMLIPLLQEILLLKIFKYILVFALYVIFFYDLCR